MNRMFVLRPYLYNPKPPISNYYYNDNLTSGNGEINDFIISLVILIDLPEKYCRLSNKNNYDLALYAVQQDGSAYYDMPSDLQDNHEIILAGLSHNDFNKSMSILSVSAQIQYDKKFIARQLKLESFHNCSFPYLVGTRQSTVADQCYITLHFTQGF